MKIGNFIRNVKRIYRQDLKNFDKMYPRIKLYGIKYLFDLEYRRKMKQRESNKRHKKLYGSAWGMNRLKRISILKKRDGENCFFCGKPLKRNITIDHIVPVSVERNNRVSNLRLIHSECRVERDRAINKGILKI